MKLHWVSHLLPFPSTGHGALQRTHHLVRQMAQVHEVHLYALSNGAGTTSDILGMGVRAATLVPFPSTAGKVRALATSLLRGGNYWDELFAHRVLAKALRASVAPGDTVLLDTIFLAPYLRAIDGISSVRVILNHHNVESQLLQQRADNATGIRRWFFAQQAQRTATAERLHARRAATNLVVSAEDASRLADVSGPVPCTVVPNGVDVDFFRGDDRAVPVPYSLVYAGGMNWFPNRDGIQWLVQEVWPVLVAAEPRRTLTIIGTSPPPEALALAARDSRVTVTGFVPDVRPYIERASAYICPIRVGGGTRLKVLDALSMGRPLIATELSVDGLEMVPETHYLRADSPAAFADGLARLDQDAALGRALAQHGRAHVESRYSWQGIGRELASALAAVAGPSA